VRSQVNITPLIDVVLVLLIIFMVLTPTTMKHMKPALAKETASFEPGPQPVLVEVTEHGVSVNGETTPWGELFAVVHERLARSHQGAVFLKIADEVEYGEAVRVMDLCKGAGATVLALPGSRG
jgi:biopolymer transport protein TolR